MRTGLQAFGVILVLFAALLLFDHYGVFRFDHPLTNWSLRWGREAAWVIRGGMMLLGLWLIFMTPRGDD